MGHQNILDNQIHAKIGPIIRSSYPIEVNKSEIEVPRGEGYSYGFVRAKLKMKNSPTWRALFFKTMVFSYFGLIDVASFALPRANTIPSNRWNDLNMWTKIKE